MKGHSVDEPGPARATDETARFFEALSVRQDLADVIDERRYTPVPDGWLALAADIEGSTALIEQGHYKRVKWSAPR